MHTKTYEEFSLENNDKGEEKADQKEKPLTTEEGLLHYFTGYTRSNPEKVKSIISDSWVEYAKKELERRKFKLIENFSEEELHAIANGDINLNDIILLAAESHKQK